MCFGASAVGGEGLSSFVVVCTSSLELLCGEALCENSSSAHCIALGVDG